MFLFILLVILLALIGIKFQKKDETNSFMSRENTLSIIGIFTILIFLTHIRQALNITYQTTSNWLDKLGSFSLGLFGEQVVAPFLFYSGFGIALSFATKKDYLNHFVFLRILKIILCFLFIVFFSLIVKDTIYLDFSNFGKECLSLFSLIKENWYIHAILICYTISFVIYLINHFVKKDSFVIITSALAGILLYIFCYFFLPFYRLCILCYFFGSLFFYVLPYFKNKLDVSKKLRILSLVSVLFIYIVSRLACYLFHYEGIGYLISYQICNFGLCFSIVMITYFISIKNKALVFIGKNTIFIYLLLGLVNIVIAKINVSTILNNSILYTLVAILLLGALTLAFSYSYNFLWSKISFVYKKIISKIFKTKKKENAKLS